MPDNILIAPSLTEFHPALNRIYAAIYKYRQGELSFRESLKKTILYFQLIESFNGVVNSINLADWEISPTNHSPMINLINIHQLDVNGKNLLDHAISHPEITKYLLSKGLLSQQAIIESIRNNHITSLSYLIDKLADQVILANSDELELANLEISNYIPLISTLVTEASQVRSSKPLEILGKTFKLYFPYINNHCLIKAIALHHQEKFNILLKYNINIHSNIFTPRRLWDIPPISAASLSREPDFAYALIKKGADVNEDPDLPIFPTLLSQPFISNYSQLNLDKIKIISLILIKNGLNLNRKYTKIDSTYSKSRIHLTSRYYNQINHVRNSILQLLNDAMLFNYSIKYFLFHKPKLNLLKTVFFDFYWDSPALYKYTNDDFNIKNIQFLKQYIEQILNPQNKKRTLDFLRNIHIISKFFPESKIRQKNPEPLSFIKNNEYLQFQQNVATIKLKANNALKNIDKFNQHIFRNNSHPIKYQVCAFLDGPSLRSLSTLNLK